MSCGKLSLLPPDLAALLNGILEHIWTLCKRSFPKLPPINHAHRTYRDRTVSEKYFNILQTAAGCLIQTQLPMAVSCDANYKLIALQSNIHRYALF